MKGRKSSRPSEHVECLDSEILAMLNLDASRMSELFQKHIANGDVSAAKYRDRCRIALGAEVLRKNRIYLDQRYWIYCRDAYLGRPQRPIHQQIWEVLCTLVDTGKVICPVAYPVLVETFKQRDPTSRAATAKVIDRLGQGVAMQPSHELIGCELHHFILKSTKGNGAVHPMVQLAWTYPAWVIGQPVPIFRTLDESTNNTLQKCVFDLLMTMPFSSLVLGEAGSFPNSWDNEAHYRKLNVGASSHQHEVTSFDTVFLSEVCGVLDVYNEIIPGLFARLYEPEMGTSAESPNAAESVRLTRNLIYHAYRLKKLKSDLPFIHIIAGLHASVRWRRQPYKSGDHWDFLHAHQALPYCNAFLTEKGLGNILCSRPLEYDKVYGCRVLWKEDAILSYVKSI